MTSYLERFEQTPEADRWPLVRSWLFNEPLAFAKELRTHRPILPTPVATIVSRFDDCQEVLRNYEIFGVDLYKPKQGSYWMAQDDTAQHWREKSIMRAVLDREDVSEIRKFVAEQADSILEAADGRIEAVNQLTRAVPISLVQTWFGFADSDPADLAEWAYWNQVDAFKNQPMDAVVIADPAEIVAAREAANEKMRDYLIELVQRRAGELQAGQDNKDIVTRLIRLSMSQALKFDIPAVVLNVGGLLIGTVETTSQAVVHALAQLFERPEILRDAQQAANSDDPTAADGYIFEALRFHPIAPYMFRQCNATTCLARSSDHETEISAETIVLAFIHSAMFDETAFDAPNQFDPSRRQDNAMHFGVGLHECLGRPIAKILIPEIARQCLRRQELRAEGPIDFAGKPYPENYWLNWTVS